MNETIKQRESTSPNIDIKYVPIAFDMDVITKDTEHIAQLTSKTPFINYVISGCSLMTINRGKMRQCGDIAEAFLVRCR